MRVTVRLFARLRDLAGSGELVRDVQPPATVQTIWRSLVADFPAIAEYERSMSVAVNADYSRMSAPVKDGDEVAFLPPVSGGSQGQRSKVKGQTSNAGSTGKCSTS